MLMGVSGLGWAAMIAIGHPLPVSPDCAIAGAPAIGDGWRSLEAGLLLYPAHRLALGWSAMVLAMVPVTLGQALTTRSRDAGDLPSFVAGYGALWLLAGLAFVPGALWVTGVFPDRGAALAVMAAAALAWRLSPFHRLAGALRRGSAPGDAFGPPRQSVLAGLRHGAGCILVCWPLMLPPLVVHDGHLVLMLTATALQWADHPSVHHAVRDAVRAFTNRRPAPRAARAEHAFPTVSHPLRGHPTSDEDGSPVADLAHTLTGFKHAAS